MTLYGERDDGVRPVFQIAMPRPPRIFAPGGTMHVVARCNNREFHFATPEDFKIVLDHGRKDAGFFSRQIDREIIGEAASKVVSQDTRDHYPEIPWANIVGMRNRLIHVYFDIDLDRVWDTVTDDLPLLISALEKIVRQGDTS